MDWSEKFLCIRCDKGGNLLICSENGCPIAVHEGCLRFPARFDDAGHFYCPHCLLKRAYAESRQALEYAQARKKALLAFIDEGMGDKEKHLEENNRAEANGNYQSKVSEANVNITCGDDKSKQDSDSILDKSIHLDKEHNVSNAEEEKTQEEEIEPSGSKREDPSLQMPKEKKISNVEAAKIPEDECETSSASIDEDSLPLHAIDERRSKRRKLIDGDSEAVLVHGNRVEQSDENKQTSPTVNTPNKSRRSSSAMIIDNVLNEKVKPSTSLKQPQQPSVKLASGAYDSGKCKRRFWTKREEEELRAGVEKFSKEPMKNIPWRKILELGQSVFDETRAPSDLKDKWRSMCKKSRTPG